MFRTFVIRKTKWLLLLLLAFAQGSVFAHEFEHHIGDHTEECEHVLQVSASVEAYTPDVEVEFQTKFTDLLVQQQVKLNASHRVKFPFKNKAPPLV